MNRFVAEFPAYFDEEESIIESKGFFGGLRVDCGDSYRVFDIYDVTRMMQQCEGEIDSVGFALLNETIVISRVRRREIEEAVSRISAASGRSKP